MSERKVLNKYYPPDFDPSKIPRMKLAKNRQYTVRLMAPFNMRCVTCGEYIYKGKKFNARKEDVENESYLGIRIYRFYIKCTRCLQEISFKTDPRNTDYEIEAGATRNFMALKLAEEQARKEEEELREEEANNPMKLLENRTEQSRNEIELLESLEELRDLNRRQQNIDYDTMLQQYDNTETVRQREERLAQLDEDYIKTIKFETKTPQINPTNKRVAVEEIIEMDDDIESSKIKKSNPPIQKPKDATKMNSNLSSGRFSIGSRLNKNLGAIVKKKLATTKSQNNPILIDNKQSDINTKQNLVPELKISDTAIQSDLPNATKVEKPNVGGSLALLGMYSDDDSSD